MLKTGDFARAAPPPPPASETLAGRSPRDLLVLPTGSPASGPAFLPALNEANWQASALPANWLVREERVKGLGFRGTA